MSRPLNLTKRELAYLVQTVKDRIDAIEGTECNNPDVREVLNEEAAALRLALDQLEGDV